MYHSYLGAHTQLQSKIAGFFPRSPIIVGSPAPSSYEGNKGYRNGLGIRRPLGSER